MIFQTNLKALVTLKELNRQTSNIQEINRYTSNIQEINGDDDLDEGDIKKIDGLDLHTVKDIVENNLWR